MADKMFANFNVHNSLHLDDLNVENLENVENSVEVDDNDECAISDDENVEQHEDMFEVDEDILDSVTPYMNQMFKSLEEAEHCFKSYALRNGFAVKIQTTSKRSNNEIYARMFVCTNSGKDYDNSDEFCEESSRRKRRRDVIPRSGCKVRMYVNHRMKLNLWEVTTLELSHNHGVVTPSKMNLIQRERHVTAAARNIIKTLNLSGIAPRAVMDVFSNLGGGVQNVGFGRQNIKNVLRDERRKKFESSDAQDALELLCRLNEESGGKFFIKTQVDDEQRLKSIVWVDPRSLMAYSNFGDVVTFDTTYRTNRYAMPFVPFTGVNHHYQSIIFGFALMRDENMMSFEWILNAWLEAVGNNYPVSIITDQDLAMAGAIASQLPYTKHLLCSWHISNKFPEKLATYYSNYPETFKVDFNNCIYNSLTEDEFEDRWKILVEKYNLADHSWLQGLYEMKEKWIIAYTRNVFSAGQNTTSRSEGMNAFFDSFVSSTTGMREFIENAQKVLERQLMREKEEDYFT